MIQKNVDNMLEILTRTSKNIQINSVNVITEDASEDSDLIDV